MKRPARELFFNLMMYILLDESGDLGFSFDKGSSRFFVMAIIFTKNKRRLEKITRIIRSGLAKKHRDIGTLHAYRDEPVTRRRLLKKLGQSDCGILAIVLDKRRIHAADRGENIVLYNRIASILIGRLFKIKPKISSDHITLIASRREVNPFLNRKFISYIISEIKDASGIDIQVEIATPAKEKSLQVVDFISWAIFQRYEKEEDACYNLIRSKLIDDTIIYP